MLQGKSNALGWVSWYQTSGKSVFPTVNLRYLFGSHGLTNEQKLNIIKSEYGIPTEDVREEVRVMCNLSQGIKEEGIAIGESRIIINMHNNGFTNQQIADVTDKELQEIETILVSNTVNI